MNGQYQTWNKDGCRLCHGATTKPYVWVGPKPLICTPCWQGMALGERLTAMREYLDKSCKGDIDQYLWTWWSDAIWKDYSSPGKIADER